MSKITGTKAFCLITGGSQGIGQGVAFEFAKVLAPDSKLCLTARSVSSLNATARKIKEINPDVLTEYVGCDLSKDFDILLKRLESFGSESYDAFFLVHNAGSEGKGFLAKDMDSVQYWQEYMSLNLYSMTAITSAFLRIFNSGAPRTIINITSLAAVAPFKGMGFYCVSKASREMYLKVLAVENPDLRILNYSPGVVKTDMISRVITTVNDQSTKQSFESLVKENKLVEPSETVGYMIKVLDEGSFKNDGRVDFFDREVTNGVAT
uniref:Sepiapterin reductase n=1 Tax=Lygus hesperus TaxID=30085 RepID=A0A0A9XDI4_LYGHE